MSSLPFQRYFIQLAYCGTAYHGWQVQDNAHTVQEEIETNLSKLLGEKTGIVGCGRTDTGVHAKKFYAHFDVSKALSDPNQLLYKLNKMLPGDISVYSIQAVDNELHSRFSALLRTYEYWVNSLKDPFSVGRSYYFSGVLDHIKMNKAASMLIGKKDFSSFSKSHTQVKTNNCDVKSALWEIQGDHLVFTISADRFLRNMVRAIVGTMIDIGRGKLEPEKMQEIITAQDRAYAGSSAPAEGLYLVDVEYPAGAIQ